LARSNQGSAPRARDLGVPFEGTPGRDNSITDVPGVEVGHSTIISGEGKLTRGIGPVRTGVTAILPRGKRLHLPVFAGCSVLNGCGEMTGTAWIEESGLLEGPILFTNTNSVGTARDAVIRWALENGVNPFFLPVVGETYDGYLNDVYGFHVRDEHVFAALDSAHSGPIEEGSVGGGTGMCSFEFKAGIGTSSRKVTQGPGGYTLGVLVQANFGLREQLLVAGVPVGRAIPEGRYRQRESGSILIVAATDAPLLPHQLKRVARRLALGLARTGSVAGNGSGDLFIAFSTSLATGADATPEADESKVTSRPPISVEMLPNTQMDPLFSAAVYATEEAVINALVAAQTMTGRDDHVAIALPHERLRELLGAYPVM
jgi:L-aminopeptidase/D-esterase-like protein